MVRRKPLTAQKLVRTFSSARLDLQPSRRTSIPEGSDFILGQRSQWLLASTQRCSRSDALPELEKALNVPPAHAAASPRVDTPKIFSRCKRFHSKWGKKKGKAAVYLP